MGIHGENRVRIGGLLEGSQFVVESRGQFLLFGQSHAVESRAHGSPRWTLVFVTLRYELGIVNPRRTNDAALVLSFIATHLRFLSLNFLLQSDQIRLQRLYSHYRILDRCRQRLQQYLAPRVFNFHETGQVRPCERRFDVQQREPQPMFERTLGSVRILIPLVKGGQIDRPATNHANVGVGLGGALAEEQRR